MILSVGAGAGSRETGRKRAFAGRHPRVGGCGHGLRGGWETQPKIWPDSVSCIFQAFVRHMRLSTGQAKS